MLKTMKMLNKMKFPSVMPEMIHTTKLKKNLNIST